MPEAGDVFFAVSKTSGVGKLTVEVEPISSFTGRGPYVNKIVCESEDGYFTEIPCKLTLPIMSNLIERLIDGVHARPLETHDKTSFDAEIIVLTNAKFMRFWMNSVVTVAISYGGKYVQVDGSLAKDEVYLTEAQVNAITVPSVMSGNTTLRLIELKDDFGVYVSGEISVKYKVPENTGPSRTLNLNVQLSKDVVPVGDTSWLAFFIGVTQDKGVTLEVEPTTMTFTASGGVKELSIECGSDWIIEE